MSSTFSFSLGTTALGGRPFSSCITDFAYFIVVPFIASGSKVSKFTLNINVHQTDFMCFSMIFIDPLTVIEKIEVSPP